MSEQIHPTVGDTIRLPHYKTAGGFRVWQIIGCFLGNTYQEGVYELLSVDVAPRPKSEKLLVPCIILDTHPALEILNLKWVHREIGLVTKEECDE